MSTYPEIWRMGVPRSSTKIAKQLRRVKTSVWFSYVEFIRSKLSIFSAHLSGVCVPREREGFPPSYHRRAVDTSPHISHYAIVSNHTRFRRNAAVSQSELYRHESSGQTQWGISGAGVHFRFWSWVLSAQWVTRAYDQNTHGGYENIQSKKLP